MSPSDVLNLPPYVAAVIAVMFWPAMWAAALFIVALTRDIVRQNRSGYETVRPSSW
jgi:hypothetical protein